MDEESENELRNPFPSPPSHYTRYTSHNLKLLALLKERAPLGEQDSLDQHQLLSDQKDVPEWPLTLLEKPRVDWILEEPEGYYDVYGDRWFIKEKIPSLAELGGTQLYPSDPSVDRRPALLSVLKSLLVTYSNLITSLLRPPPTAPDVRPEWERQVEWINVLSQNLMAAANDLRPMQARCNLELMMEKQLSLRKEETKLIHEKCNELELKLQQLRSSAADVTTDAPKINPANLLDSMKDDASQRQPSQLEVLQWAEEI